MGGGALPAQTIAVDQPQLEDPGGTQPLTMRIASSSLSMEAVEVSSKLERLRCTAAQTSGRIPSFCAQYPSDDLLRPDAHQNVAAMDENDAGPTAVVGAVEKHMRLSAGQDTGEPEVCHACHLALPSTWLHCNVFLVSMRCSAQGTRDAASIMTPVFAICNSRAHIGRHMCRWPWRDTTQ